MKHQTIFLIILFTLFSTSKAVGSYQPLETDLSAGLQNTENHPLKDIQDFMRKQFQGKAYLQNRQIGEVVMVETQVVAGLNYRYTFKNSRGEKFQATVFDQPWNRVRKLTHLDFLVEQEV